MIDAWRLALVRPDAMVFTTGRAGLIDTTALVAGVGELRLGGVGLGVHTQEVICHDLSDEMVHDNLLARVLTYRHVLVSSHMRFPAREELAAIADTVVASLSDCEAGRRLAKAPNA